MCVCVCVCVCIQPIRILEPVHACLLSSCCFLYFSFVWQTRTHKQTHIHTYTQVALVGGGLNGDVYALTVFNGMLAVGGAFSQVYNAGSSGANSAGSLNTGGLAFWDGGKWNMPGGSDSQKGMVGVATCFAVLNGNQLFVGGKFTSIGGVEGFSGVASYSAVTKTWSSYGGGVVGREVRAVAASKDALYVVGSLNKAGDTEVSNVAMWSFAKQKWLPMSGFNAEVRAVAVHMGRVFVGGEFSMAGYQPTSMVAQITEANAQDGVNAWKPLGGGTNGPVHVSMMIY